MNPQKGDVSFEAGGRSYTLRYSHLSLVKLEKSLDKGLVEIMGEISKPDRMRLGTVIALLWAGMQKHHPEVTEEDAANLLDEIDGGVAGMMPVIDSAFGKAFGTTPGTKGTNPIPKDNNGSGTISLSSTLVTDTTQTHFGTSRPKN